jgi:23S rRNA pseudouridine2605 synthase
MKPERIAKVIAAAGLCSRRDAELWIVEGRVSVNGKTLTSPALTVTSDDAIKVDGKLLKQKDVLRVWLYHKPAGLVTTAKDPEGRPTVFEALPASMGRVISVGRLDLNSEGLLLLTNDGAFSRHLELPKNEFTRQYEVRVFGDVDPDALVALQDGITVDGINYRGIEAVQEKPGSRAMNQWLYVTLHEGKNREIRNVMRALDLRVNRLVRVEYGPFKLGELEPSQVKEVPAAQLKRICETIGYAP